MDATMEGPGAAPDTALRVALGVACPIERRRRLLALFKPEDELDLFRPSDIRDALRTAFGAHRHVLATMEHTPEGVEILSASLRHLELQVRERWNSRLVLARWISAVFGVVEEHQVEAPPIAHEMSERLLDWLIDLKTMCSIADGYRAFDRPTHFDALCMLSDFITVSIRAEEGLQGLIGVWTNGGGAAVRTLITCRFPFLSKAALEAFLRTVSVNPSPESESAYYDIVSRPSRGAEWRKGLERGDCWDQIAAHLRDAIRMRAHEIEGGDREGKNPRLVYTDKELPQPNVSIARLEVEAIVAIHQKCRLTPRELEVVIGHYWLGESLAEVARRIGIDAATARVLHFDAKKKMTDNIASIIDDLMG